MRTEAPEITFIALSLRKMILGKTVTQIRYAFGSNYLKLPQTVVRVIPSGDLIYIYTSQNIIVIRLGLYGWITTRKPKNWKAILYFDNRPFYIESSNINPCFLKKKIDIDFINIFSDEFVFNFFKEELKQHSPKQTVYKFLTENTRFKGIGDYIANDSLYIANISPFRSIENLRYDEVERLFNSLLHVAYSSLLTYLKQENFFSDFQTYLRALQEKETTPSLLNIPYTYYVYNQPRDSFGNKVYTKYSLSSHKTFFVNELQI